MSLLQRRRKRISHWRTNEQVDSPPREGKGSHEIIVVELLLRKYAIIELFDDYQIAGVFAYV